MLNAPSMWLLKRPNWLQAQPPGLHLKPMWLSMQQQIERWRAQNR